MQKINAEYQRLKNAPDQVEKIRGTLVVSPKYLAWVDQIDSFFNKLKRKKREYDNLEAERLSLPDESSSFYLIYRDIKKICEGEEII